MYWRALNQGHVPVSQIVAQRLVWSCVVVFLMLCATKQLGVVRGILKKPRLVLQLAFGSALTSSGWLIYIGLVNSGQVLQASLSTYLSPIVLMAIGVVVFKDRLTPLKWLAMAFTVIGVAFQVGIIGTLPWMVLAMVLVTSSYRLLRAVIHVDAMSGLFIENLVAVPVSIVFITYWHSQGTLVFLQGDVVTDLLVFGTGIITAFPLMWSVFGARNAPFTTLGLINFTAPSMIFLMGVFVFKETFTSMHLVSFVFIWIALAMYTLDSVRQIRARTRRKEPVAQASAPATVPRAY